MAEYTAEDAAQALTAAWEQDSGSDPAAQDAPSAGPESNQDGGQPSGLFYDVDPEQLTPELRTMFDGMQKAFTEKNQALSEERRAYESLGGFDQVQQAVEFVTSLQSPENLISLHGELSEYLQAAGYTKGDADAAAASAIQDQVGSPEAGGEQDYGFSDPEVQTLQSELAELKAWRNEFEVQQETARLELEIERAENALRSDRGYDDSDVARIYNLAYAHGGNLFAAAEAYDQMRNELLSGYVQQKGEAPSPAANVVGTFGQEPKSFGSDFDAAHQEAKRIAIAAMNAGAFDD